MCEQPEHWVPASYFFALHLAGPLTLKPHRNLGGGAAAGQWCCCYVGGASVGVVVEVVSVDFQKCLLIYYIRCRSSPLKMAYYLLRCRSWCVSTVHIGTCLLAKKVLWIISFVHDLEYLPLPACACSPGAVGQFFCFTRNMK